MFAQPVNTAERSVDSVNTMIFIIWLHSVSRDTITLAYAHAIVVTRRQRVDIAFVRSLGSGLLLVAIDVIVIAFATSSVRISLFTGLEHSWTLRQLAKILCDSSTSYCTARLEEDEEEEDDEATAAFYAERYC